MGSHSTTYTANGSTTDSYSGSGVLFIQVPVSYSTSNFGAATVTSFDVGLSSQSGNDVLSIQNHTSTWDGNTENVTVSGNQVSVNNTVYGTYNFANQDLVFSFSSGNSNPDIIGAIMDAVAYQNTASVRLAAQTETVTWSFSPSGTTAPSDTINIAALPPTTTYTGVNHTGATNAGSNLVTVTALNPVVFVEDYLVQNGAVPLTYSVTNAAAAVTSFDANLDPVAGSAQFDSLSIQNRTTTWDGNSESVTTSGDQVYVNNTLAGTYSFSGHDLVFTFVSANSNPDTLGAILDAVAFQSTGAGTEAGQNAIVSFSFTSNGVVTAPSTWLSVPLPPTVAFAPAVTTVATYAGVPVSIQPGLVSGPAEQTFTSAEGGDTFHELFAETIGLKVSIVNPHAGDELLYSGPSVIGTPGNPSAGDAGDTLASITGSGTTTISLIYNIPQFLASTGPDFATLLAAIQYENTSATPPSSAQIQVSFQGLQTEDGSNTAGFGPVPLAQFEPVVTSDPLLTVNLTPLPSVTTESATVTTGGAVSGTAGITGTGALANDSDANAGFTLSVSAVSGGTLGSALHGTYGDLTLNADGSFSYAAGATTAELAAIAAATGQVTDAFTYSVSDGHGGVTSSTLDIDLNATKPSVSGIAFSPASGDLAVHASETITLSLANVGAVDIAGNGPTLTLNDGGTATYDAAASTGTSWVFDYQVASTDTDVASLAVSSVNLNGTTLTNPSGVATATTSLPVAGLTQSGPQIDTTTPAVTAVAENPSSGEIGLGTKVTFTLTLNDPVTVDTTNGAPTLKLNDNGIATFDAAASTGTSLVFDYTLSGTDIANVASLQATSFNLGGAVIDNGAGTAANVSLTGLSQSGPTIDLPQVMGGFAAPSSGIYGAGETMALFVEFNKAVTATGNITLSLNDGGTATLDAADTSLLQQNGYVVFDYKVAPTDHDVSSLSVTGINLNNGTILDSLGDEAQFSGTLPTFSNIEIDTGKPSIASIAFSPSSGDLTIGASETITLGLSDVGTIDIAGNGPTLTLNDGGTATYDAAASTGTSLVFDYKVTSSDTDVASLAVNSVNLNGSTLTNLSDTATVTSLSVAGLAQSGPQIDTTPPGPTVTTLYNFSLGNTVGNSPDSSLILDAAGDLFGTTEGVNGTVFELQNAGNGFYIASNLFGFPTNGTISPSGPGEASGLVADAAGDLFGTVSGGVGGEGVAFELVPDSNVGLPPGGYQFKTLVQFPNFFPDPNGNGTNPVGGLIVDAAGDLFGTTQHGGANGEGTVFELVPQNNGVFYTATTLFSFDGSDGADPQAGLLADAAGDLFGTTGFGASGNLGTVFELINNGNGNYTQTTLLSFDGANGANPQAGLIADAAGDLFGTTANGGTTGDGTVFELVNNGHGSYTQKTLLSFDLTNGRDPQGGLLADAAGDLFGTTAQGGSNDGGTVFELVKNPDGSYTPVTLVNFNGADGADPLGGLIADAAGDLFGTTLQGGTVNFGTVFELTDTGFQTACYRRGTLIEAARGQKKVEALQIGDKVRTASGKLRPIKWIGRRSYAGRFVLGRKDILPVCIKSGALADNVPARDLWVSPNHAMFLSGVLIEAKDLINGVSIVQAEAVETLEYFHVELDSHDVIIAEGALSESFIDDDSRGMFHNAHDYDTLYAEMPAAAAHYCAPRLDEGYEVEAVRQRLALRSGLLRRSDTAELGALRGYVDRVRATGIAGWAQNTDAPEAPVCLDIFADGKLIGQVLANSYRNDLKAAGLGSGRHGFTFTPRAGLVFAADAIEVRRSLDGAPLDRSGATGSTSTSVTVHRRAAVA